MTNTSRLMVFGPLLAAIACGPTPTNKPVTASVRTDGPQPESTEWLYATPASSGVVKDECKLVIDVLDKERKCSGDLCRHALNLGEDWLKTCREYRKGDVTKVAGWVSAIRARAKKSGGECAYQGVQLIDKGCPEAADCAVAAQTWATKCSKHASPLVVRMIEKQVERGTQTPIKLDTTPCDEVFAKLTKTPTCTNDFECEEKLGELKSYQARCVDMTAPLPLDDALKQALLLQSAKQTPPPFLVQEDRFAPRQGRLLLDDGSGFVLAVGDSPAPNVNLLIKTLRDSEYTLPVRVARIFRGKGNRHQLRLGSLEVPDAATFFRRFQSLKVTGQSEALNSQAANRAIGKLNEVVKEVNRQQTALAGLVEALGAAVEVQSDAEFKAEVAKADQHLAPIFERLAREKRAKLPRANVRGERMRDRVAYARRAWNQPFADVTSDGRVVLGATTPATLIDVEALLPRSFEQYREGIDGTIGKALRSLQAEQEAELIANAQKLAEDCAAKRKAAARHEAALVECSFGIDNCSGADIEKNSKQLDDAIAAQRARLAEVEVALLQLEKPPGEKLKTTLAQCRR